MFNRKAIFAAAALFAFGLPGQASAADIENGKKVAKEICAACHKLDGNGIDDSYPRLAGQYADYILQTLEDYTSGARANPIMKGIVSLPTLDAKARRDVAAYYASMSGGVETIQAYK